MSEIREIVLSHAVEDAVEVQKIEHQMVDAEEEVRDLQLRVNQMERRHRILGYPGKSQEVRDAQMADSMAQDDVLESARLILVKAETSLNHLRAERDGFKRFYMAACCFLRSE